MKNILITGSKGFVGKNLLYRLRELNKYNILEYDINNTEEELFTLLQKSDIVFHLAGVNRPKNEKEFSEVNSGLTETIINYLRENNLKPYIIFSSSIQAELENPYGRSKLSAEKLLENYATELNATVNILRLPNVFGKWCRPNYNSAVATFCYNVANDFKIEIHDRNKLVQLFYIDDFVDLAFRLIKKQKSGFSRPVIEPVYSISVGELADLISSFDSIRKTKFIPSFENQFTKKLYSTFLSYLPESKWTINTELKKDNRGSLTELIKSENFGQIFVSTTKPGITRGNHYHHTKTEKFIVIKGDAEINFRKIDTTEVIKINVNGNNIQIVDIPPGYTHNITNTGQEDLIVLFWANEIFNQEKPDTNFLEV